MPIKRPKKFLMIFLIPLIYLMCVILNIAVFKGEIYTNMAASQRTHEIHQQRGVITDRNMIPFTDNETRYNETSLARHIIGYTDSGGTGISGIEKELNKELSEKTPYYALKDASGNEIPNFKKHDFITTNRKYVKLTLDYHIQCITENVLDANGQTGAVVILDVDNFDVLAMASRPDFDQNNVAQHIQNGGTSLINRAQTPYNSTSMKTAMPFLITENELTPFEVASKMCTAATKGIRKDVNLIDGIAFENGYTIKSLRKNKTERILSKTVARQIPCEFTDGVWATGYFPENNPEYAMCVLTENGSGAYKIYSEIKEEITTLNIH